MSGALPVTGMRMSAAFFITLREGLEAALIVGIIAAYLVKVERRDLLPSVVAGVLVAAALCVGVGILVVGTIGRLPLAIQATLEGLGALLAVVVVTWMLFWMRRQGRGLKGELEGRISEALARGSAAALVGMAFLAVIREGFETVLFLLAVLGARGDTVGALVGGIAGLVVAAAIGWAIFAMGVRIDLRRFFTATGVLLILVAAGLVSYAIAELTEAGLLPVTPVAFDLTRVLPESSPLGSVLSGLLGYRAAPSVLQVVGSLAYLVPVLLLFLFDDRLRLRRQAVHVRAP